MDWNHKGPVVFTALFAWPPKPRAALEALTKRWLTIHRNTLFVAVALVGHFYFSPDLAKARNISLDWLIPMLLKNVSLMVIFAGGLHLFLFTFKKQGKKLKYDHRTDIGKSRKHSFGNQLYDNIFWSIVSGTTVWTLYEALYYTGVARGLIQTTDNPLVFICWLFLLPTILGSHFYFTHRLLHWPPMFKRFHVRHHLNIHTGPWSGMSLHPVESVIYISSVLVHFVIPSHPVMFLVHLYARCLGPAFSHAGFEKIIMKDDPVLDAADFHHQLHHKYFDCNYGSVDAPWDEWFGSAHDGSIEAEVRIRERRKMLIKRRN